ncbi:MAG: hypothetical protein M3Y72_17445 [Acidobacteriota bacterium]|nr:hypothetical protein [Acidobacteriota bacterium]
MSSKRSAFTALSCSLFFAAGSLVCAQGRIGDEDLESLMRNLHEDAKSFRPVFAAAIHSSTIRKTSREKDAKDLATRFEKQTNAMLKQFKQSRKADTSLPPVRSTAQKIAGLVHSLNLGPQTASRWSRIEAELQQISAAFGISNPASDQNLRGIAPYRQATDNSNAPACIQAVGPVESKKLVDDCLAVSPATHPPCNSQNSCALIIDEIKRSCALLDARSAPAFCSEYK